MVERESLENVLKELEKIIKELYSSKIYNFVIESSQFLIKGDVLFNIEVEEKNLTNEQLQTLINLNFSMMAGRFKRTLP